MDRRRSLLAASAAILVDGENSVNLNTFYVSEGMVDKPNIIEYTATEGMIWEE